MPAVYTRQLLSGSTNGLPIPVAATATPGTLVHAAIAGATSFDEVYIWASNVTAAPASLTVEWGGVADPANLIVKGYIIPANSVPMPIAVGQVVNGAVEVRAFATIASSINLTGYVNRITA